MNENIVEDYSSIAEVEMNRNESRTSENIQMKGASLGSSKGVSPSALQSQPLGDM